MNGVGQEVKRIREGKGWIQAKLAVEAGMAPSAVNQIENGKRAPSARSLDKLATALGVEVADLFPKALAPLPLEDTGRRGATEEGGSYTAFEAFGRVLASTWRDELAGWDEEVPDDTDLDTPEPDLDTPASLRFAQWVIGVLETAGTFEAVAHHGGGTPREELADTLALVKDVTSAVSRKALKQHKRLATDRRFREIVAANEEPARDTPPAGPSRRVRFPGGPSWAEIASDAFRQAADPTEAPTKGA